MGARTRCGVTTIAGLAVVTCTAMSVLGCSLDRVGLAAGADAGAVHDGGGGIEGGARADAGDADAPRDAGELDAGDVDAGGFVELDAGTDAGTDAGLVPMLDGGPYETHVRECESGRLVGRMVLGGDPEASALSYVHAATGVAMSWSTDSTSLPPDRVEHDFALGRTGTWYLWVRLYTISASEDALYAGFAGADLRRFFVTEWGSWRWVSGPNLRFDALAAGAHTLAIGPGETGPRCDRIVMTTDPAFDPDSLP